MFRHLFLQALLIFVQIEPDHVLTPGHGGRHGTGLQLKHVLDQLMLLLTQHPRQRASFKYRVDIVRGDVIFTHHRQLKQTENGIGQAVKEPHQRAEHEETEAHRVDDAQSHSFWRNHTDAFRGQIGKENEQASHQ